MTAAHQQTDYTLHVDPSRLGAEACKGDDASLMSQAVLTVSKPESGENLAEFMAKTLQLAIQRGATSVLAYLLDHGADVAALRGLDIAQPNGAGQGYPKETVLELLLAHGWDINARNDRNPVPFLRRVLDNDSLVLWSITHGAKVHQPGDILPGDLRNQSLLEIATYKATPATFDLLMANGAPFSPRTLHVAVQYAARASPYYGNPPDADFRRCMDMVQHLVEVLKVDVNADERCLKYPFASPLHFLGPYRVDKDFRELVWYLLDHGLDPNRPYELYDQDISALQYGIQQGNDRFVAAIQEWQVRRGKTP